MEHKFSLTRNSPATLQSYSLQSSSSRDESSFELQPTFDNKNNIFKSQEKPIDYGKNVHKMDFQVQTNKSIHIK